MEGGSARATAWSRLGWRDDAKSRRREVVAAPPRLRAFASSVKPESHFHQEDVVRIGVQERVHVPRKAEVAHPLRELAAGQGPDKEQGGPRTVFPAQHRVASK